jgi:hypothetical protein
LSHVHILPFYHSWYLPLRKVLDSLLLADNVWLPILVINGSRYQYVCPQVAYDAFCVSISSLSPEKKGSYRWNQETYISSGKSLPREESYREYFPNCRESSPTRTRLSVIGNRVTGNVFRRVRESATVTE